MLGRVKKKELLFVRLPAVIALAVLLLPISAQALTQAQKDALGSGARYFNTEDCSTDLSAASSPPAKLDLAKIAGKYGLQTAIVKQFSGEVVGSFRADQPPNSPASVLKLIIADALLSANPALNRKVRVTAAEVYDRGNASTRAQGSNPYPFNPPAGYQLTLSEALEEALTWSSDTDANVLIDAGGGPDAVTTTAHKLGYKDTQIKAYYSASATQVLNSTTVTDLTDSLEHIFTAGDGGYKEAQANLSSPNRETFGIDSIASKWGGVPGTTTHKPATGNSALVNINSQKYIITMYSPKAYIGTSPQGVTDIRDATNAIIEAITTANPAGASAQTCCTNSPDFGNGSLPPSVPKPYNGILTAAANKFQIAPAFLAALFYAGEHGSSWPDPPPPYGHGQPWADSHVTGSNQDWPPGTPGTRPIGARGPFQFEYPAWRSHGQDGNGDGKKDVEDLVDAAFGSANYLAGFGIRNTTDTAKLHDAARRYNGSGQQAEAYADKVMAAYQKFSQGGSAPGSGDSSSTTADCGDSSAISAYKFPYRDVKNLQGLRIDQGVDYGGHGPVYAMGSGTVLNVYNCGWGSCASPPLGGPGAFIVYKLTAGPAKGKFVYMAENCPWDVQKGDQVTYNTVICNLQEGSPWSETGWADGQSIGQTLAHSVYHEGFVTAYGVNFAQLMKCLGDKTPHERQTAQVYGDASDMPTWQC